MTERNGFLAVALLLLVAGVGQVSARPGWPNPVQSARPTIHVRERVEIMQGFWDWKRENVLPMILREQGVDMWIVRNDERPEYRQASFKEGPVYTSLLPANHEGMVLPSRYREERILPSLEALVIPDFLMFYDTGDEIEYVEPRDYAHITELVRVHDPQNIAISQTNNDAMLRALAEYGSRTVDSWTLAVRWLETMGPEQINVYRYVQGVASDIIAAGFSNSVVIPGVTTVDDLNWWFRQEMLDLNVENENHPSISIQRRPANVEQYADEHSPAFFRDGPTQNGMNVTIRRGDIISSAADIMLLGLEIHVGQHAYVLQEGEETVPDELQEALRIANRVQDAYAREFQYGRTAREIVEATSRVPLPEGVVSSGSGLGFHAPPMFLRRFSKNGLMFTRGTYVAGMSFRDTYDRHPLVSGDHPLHYNTLYSFEPITWVAVPGWGERGVEIGVS